MSSRRVQLILLCEDSQHEAFVRRFFKEVGKDARVLRVLKAPKGRGSGEQWVREQYAKEVSALRAAKHIEGRALVVMIDSDTKSRDKRGRQLAAELEDANLSPRDAEESIIHAIPARNIETWIAYLGGEEVSETETYPRLDRERECAPMVAQLKEFCDARQLREPAPDSLEAACTEFRTRWP